MKQILTDLFSTNRQRFGKIISNKTFGNQTTMMEGMMEIKKLNKSEKPPIELLLLADPI